MSGVWFISSRLLATTASTFVQLCAGWTAVLPIAGLAIYGWFHGVFLAVIAGLQLLASFILASAGAQPLAESLETFGVPAGRSLAVAYILIFAGSVTAIRLAVGAWVPEGAVRFASLLDRVAGACLGAVAGAVLGGACLVGWSLAGPPDWIRFDVTHLPFDSGRRILWTFARCAMPNNESAQQLFAGDQPVTGTAAAPIVHASEPFIDVNGNDLYDGQAGADGAAAISERYLDLDGDGAFTPTMRCQDGNGDGSRAIGLHDLYRLADWSHVRCLHAPRITSDATAEIRESQPIEEPIYRASAVDVDRNDAVTFHVKPADGEGELDVTVDPATGVVTLLQSADFERAKRHVFAVEARDRSGLSDEKVVTVRVRDVALE